jgi:hypothetical protein
MTEGTHIPGSPACGEWEAQLTDALDGLLSPEEEARFEAHKLLCPACTELYEEARKGREWLEFLSPEPEPPEWLLAKILASTGPGHEVSGLPAGVDAVPDFVPPVYHPTDEDLSVGTPVWQQVGFVARMRASAAPRMAMTAAMAFFSIALTLNLTGVGLNSLRMADLRPSALRSYMERQLNMASVPIVRYYDHLRFVHEVESRVRELQSRNLDDGNGDVRQPKQTQPATPGESRKIREQEGKGAREQESKKASRPSEDRTAPAESYGSVGGANGEFVETALRFPMLTRPSNGVVVSHPFRTKRGMDGTPDRLRTERRENGTPDRQYLRAGTMRSKHTSGHSGGSVVQGLERSSPWIA